jgi:hypothetical protein
MASLFYSNEELKDRKFRRGNSSANEKICCFSPPLLVAARNTTNHDDNRQFESNGPSKQQRKVPNDHLSA